MKLPLEQVPLVSSLISLLTRMTPRNGCSLLKGDRQASLIWSKIFFRMKPSMDGGKKTGKKPHQMTVPSVSLDSPVDYPSFPLIPPPLLQIRTDPSDMLTYLFSRLIRREVGHIYF